MDNTATPDLGHIPAEMREPVQRLIAGGHKGSKGLQKHIAKLNHHVRLAESNLDRIDAIINGSPAIKNPREAKMVRAINAARQYLMNLDDSELEYRAQQYNINPDTGIVNSDRWRKDITVKIAHAMYNVQQVQSVA